MKKTLLALALIGTVPAMASEEIVGTFSNRQICLTSMNRLRNDEGVSVHKMMINHNRILRDQHVLTQAYESRNRAGNKALLLDVLSDIKETSYLFKYPRENEYNTEETNKDQFKYFSISKFPAKMSRHFFSMALVHAVAHEREDRQLWWMLEKQLENHADKEFLKHFRDGKDSLDLCAMYRYLVSGSHLPNIHDVAAKRIQYAWRGQK